MWKLRNVKKEHLDHFIFVDEECVVGRKDAKLLISNDPSVSRKHAVLYVKHPEENLGYPSRKSSLFMRDEGSKYGTFKNGVRITAEVQLSDGDIVKFGQFESEFRVHTDPLIVTTSCLDSASKNKLKKVIHILGGHLVSEWQPSCTHLVMSLVKVTVKALCCLVSLKPIVLPEYFEELLKKLSSSATSVSPKEYIPPVGESLIDKDVVSFDINPHRKNIFKNKAFFFMDNKQFKKLHLGIITGGGTASVLSENRLDPDILLQDNSCFIEPIKGEMVNEESKNFLKDIVNTLQKKNLRMIPESDIGLAVAYASTEKFCNPSFNVGSVVLSSQKIESQTLSQREVYVPDTQERSERLKRPRSLLLNSDPKSKKQKLDAPDSLNLTTSKTENIEDIFEIPLSADIKQELNDLFDCTMEEANEEKVEEEEEIASTLQIEPEIKVNKTSPTVTEKVQKDYKIKSNQARPTVTAEIPRDYKRKENQTRSAETEEIPKEQNPPKKPKVERNTSVVNGNGFTSFDMNGHDEVDIPRNLINVKFASLIVRKPEVTVEQQNGDSHVKNFKKFKKVLPRKAQALPRIIGGHDLIPYDKDAAKFENFVDDEVEVFKNKPVKGAFDWDSQAS